MGNANCCAQTAPDVYAWKTGDRCRTLSRGGARALMPMYDYEPSLSLDHEGRTSSIDDAMSSLGFSPDTPLSVSSSHGFGDQSTVIVSAEGVVQIQDDFEEEKAPAPADDEFELSPEARALLPAPNSCPRSGINLRAQSPILSSNHSASCNDQSIGADPPQPCIEDYLCTCNSCPRAMMIQRAFKLYSFALDHPESDALLRVLRACANYDETIIEMDPLLVLHAEKMLEQLGFDEDQAFRLLLASHFQRP
ncbi:hypothetical protein PF004_g1260 [Phytophthora fragariae]|uniref:Uncharacterized protein n=1 Tax=Phytophthora fragariae TaxID=53985 RepID=A0A6G0PTC9_9STRA|nr:hypothetical protein PF004_g1260 [Phytophthora fragariae]